jgi:hypothetical protein
MSWVKWDASEPANMTQKIIAKIRSWKFNDRAAILVLVLLVVFGSLTPVLRALTNVPYFGSYVFEMGRVLPRLRYQFFLVSEVDCIGYYSYLRSLAIDRDLDFENDFARFGWPSRGKEKTVTGLTHNPWSVGPAILWSPGFLLGHLYSNFLNTIGFRVPVDGVSFIYDFFIVLTAMAYGLVGLIFIFLFLRFFFSVLISFLSLIFLFYASSMVFYQFHEPSMSHVLTVFAVSGFIYYWYKNWLNKSLKDWAWLGVWGGLIILIRQQDVFFVAVPVLAEVIAAWRNSGKIDLGFLRGPILAGIVTAICFIPQMLAWRILYGSYLTVPQGSGFMQWTSPALWPMLFSTDHGLITYTPIMLFALIGLFLFDRGDKKGFMIFWVFFTIFVLEYYVNSAVSDWAAGWAFGARRFLSCSVIFAWGLGNLFSRVWDNKAWRYALIGVFSFLAVFNLLFYVQWAYAMIPRAGTLTGQQYFLGKIDALRLWLRILGELFSIITS